MPYGSHPDSNAQFRLLDPSRQYYFFGDDNVIHSTWTTIELATIPRGGIEGLLIGLDQGILECLDWTADDIRFYFLGTRDTASDISFVPVLPDLPQTNVQDAIEQLLEYTVTDQNHVHANKPLLDLITDAGSGQVITNAERTKLQGIETNATRDQIASEVPFTPDGDITASNIQDAITEVRDDTDIKLGGKSDVGHTHDAADINDLSTAIANDPSMHVHGNKPVLDQITDAGSGQIITALERTKLAGIEPGATTDQLASEVPIVDAGGHFTSTHVEGALQELGPNKHAHVNLAVLEQITSAGSGAIITTAERNKLAGIEAGATGDQNASEVPFTPSGDIVATDVQGAIVEVRNDTDAKLAAHSHHASNIGFSNVASGMSSSNVQEALEELDSRVDNLDDDTHTHANQAVLNQISSAGSGQIITAVERAKLASIEEGATADQSASEVPYSPAISGLDATDVQAAIDEVSEKLDTLQLEELNHQSLLNLQGGTASERYHLTQAQLQGLTQGNPTGLHKHEASGITYNNVDSELEADTVQEALDEVAAYTKDLGNFGSYEVSTVSDQSIPSATQTQVIFNLVKEDSFLNTETLFTLGVDGTITFHKAAKYEVYMSAAFDQINYGSLRRAKLLHTNEFDSPVKIAGNSSVPSSTDFTFIAAAAVFDVSVGDKLKVLVEQDSGTPLNLHSNWTILTIKSGKDFIVSGSGGTDPSINDHDHKAIYAYYNAGENLLAGQIVKLGANKVVYKVSNSLVDDADRVIGIVVQSVNTGEEAQIVTYGYIKNLSWNWIANKVLYVDLNGNISQIYTPRAFLQVIATAVAQNELFIEIQEAVIGFDPDDAGQPDMNTMTNVVKYDNSNLSINSNDTLIYQFDIIAWRTAKVVIQAKSISLGLVQASELLITHDGTTPFVTEYGNITNAANDILDFDIQIDGTMLTINGILNVAGNVPVCAQIILLPT